MSAASAGPANNATSATLPTNNLVIDATRHPTKDRHILAAGGTLGCDLSGTIDCHYGFTNRLFTGFFPPQPHSNKASPSGYFDRFPCPPCAILARTQARCAMA